MAKIAPVEFVRQVRSEMKKVTWPSRKETGISVVFVFLMVVITAAFLFFADQVLSWLVRMVLSVGM